MEKDSRRNLRLFKNWLLTRCQSWTDLPPPYFSCGTFLWILPSSCPSSDPLVCHRSIALTFWPTVRAEPFWSSGDLVDRYVLPSTDWLHSDFYRLLHLIPFDLFFLLKTISTIVLTHNLLSTSITIEDHRREWMTLPSPPSVFDWSPDSPLSNTERIKMSTRGGWIVKPENSQTFSQLLNQVRSFWIFFWILQEIRRIRENVRIVRPVRGKQIQQKLNLLKWKSVKIGYVLGWDKPVYPLKSCRNLNTKYIDTKP
jgi:hypothetical protein